ncbi:MAG: hypothetical protein NZR01_03390, partial [Bryobacteraceae bacterium]|nr:hypothetical protein [Bryobacteraceae bacterium]
KAAPLRKVMRPEAAEIGFQPKIGVSRSGRLEEFVAQIPRLAAPAGRPVESILDFGFLDEDARRTRVGIAEECGMTQISHSSGIGPRGSRATPKDVRWLRRHLKGKAGIHASGEIRTSAEAERCSPPEPPCPEPTQRWKSLPDPPPNPLTPGEPSHADPQGVPPRGSGKPARPRHEASAAETAGARSNPSLTPT